MYHNVNLTCEYFFKTKRTKKLKKYNELTRDTHNSSFVNNSKTITKREQIQQN